MPRSGALPKEGAVTRTPKVHGWVEVPNVPFEAGPPLPPLRGGAKWPVWTQGWWEAVRSMPHAALWTPSDWRYAFDTAVVARKFHLGDVTCAAELRIREKQMGTTYDSRMGLRIRYVDVAAPQPAAGGNVSALDDYRDL